MGHCRDCLTNPVMKCGRCTTTHCSKHRLQPGVRCDRCECDWQEEASTRRAAKVIFAPPIAILVGGLLLGLLFPISLGGAFATAVVCSIVCAVAVGAGAGACRLVDHSSRVMFLREKAGRLPPARLLPSRTR